MRRPRCPRLPDALALVAGNLRLSAKQFREEVDHWAAAVAASAGSQRRAVLVASPGVNTVFLLFGALTAGLHVRIVAPGADPAAAAGVRSSCSPTRPFVTGAAPSTSSPTPTLRDTSVHMDPDWGNLLLGR